MKNLRFCIPFFVGILSMIFLVACTEKDNKTGKAGNFHIGWASVDITPEQPVLIRGALRARVSEGVMDPLMATVLVMESGAGPLSEKVIMVSCDLIAISDGMVEGLSDNLRDNVRRLLKAKIPEINPDQIILNATHTHAAPDVTGLSIRDKWGVDVEAMSSKDLLDFVANRIVSAAEQAWKNRKPGGISYGLGQAVVGHNRLQVAASGESYMYGDVNRPEFSHIEGYEDHGVNLLYTWDSESALTGVVVNIACPSQVTGGYQLSADFWHDTREELRGRLGEHVYVFAQLSAAGDQSPKVMVAEQSEDRMHKMMFPNIEDKGIRRRKAIAMEISNAVASVMPYIKGKVDWDPLFSHQVQQVELSRRMLSKTDVDNALIGDWHNQNRWTPKEFENKYKQSLRALEEDPKLKEKPRWYGEVSHYYMMMKRGYGVKERYELQQVKPKLPVEVHVVRIGDIVMATNPFELYLDFGMRIKARSPAVQTFLVQLSGDGTYVPVTRSVAGGSYGAAPTSTLIGPEGGQELVEGTLDLINAAWEAK